MTLRERTRRLGLTKVGNAYTITDPHGRKVWIKRVTPKTWTAATRVDRVWVTVAVGKNLDEVVEGVMDDPCAPKA